MIKKIFLIFSLILTGISSVSSQFIPPINIVTTSAVTGDAVATFIEGQIYTTSSTTPSITGNIGTASSDRYVVVLVQTACASSCTLNSTLTIGATTANRLVTAQYDGNQRETAIYISDTPIVSGTSATITATVSNNSVNTGFQIYTITSLSSTTPIATATDISSPWSQSISVNSGGVIIAGFRINAITTNTWGGTGITENYDASGAASNTYSSASGNYVSSSSPTVSVTPGSGSSGGLAIVSMR